MISMTSGILFVLTALAVGSLTWRFCTAWHEQRLDALRVELQKYRHAESLRTRSATYRITKLQKERQGTQRRVYLRPAATHVQGHVHSAL